MIEALNQDLVGVLLALGLGLLIGAERESSAGKPIGVRSIALLSLGGAIAALLSDAYSAFVLAASVLASGVLLATFLFVRVQSSESAGFTTIGAALLALLVGALAGAGLWAVAVLAAGVVTLLLHWKDPMHAWIDRLGKADFDIIARFVLIALVVLPVLPDDSFDPYEAFNPFRSWVLVVLIVGINLAGYVAFRFAGAASGAWLGGLLGGAISSTATTISYASLSKRQPDLGRAAALVIILASAVVYLRVVFELSVISPGLLRAALAPFAVFALILVVVAWILGRRVDEKPLEMPTHENPAQLGTAVGIAAVYVVILFAVAIAREQFGNEAIYIVALLSGLTDVDALTLSVAQLHDKEKVSSEVAWRAIFLATLSNLAFKTGAACVLGSIVLRHAMLVAGSGSLILGAAMLALWP